MLGDGFAGFGEQDGAEVEAGVAARAFLLNPLQAEGAGAAAEVEPVTMWGDGVFQQAMDAGLDAATGVGEGVTEGLVEFTVKREKLLAGGFLHGLDYTLGVEINISRKAATPPRGASPELQRTQFKGGTWFVRV